MPKSSLKKKSLNTDNSKLINKFNINGNNTDNFIKPSFPPTLTINDLSKNSSKPSISNRIKTFPNAFIAYRTALIKEYRINNCKLPPMGKFSKIAKNSWDGEPDHVKDFYGTLVMNAKSIYKQNNVQIVLDKHMDYIESNKEGARVTYGAKFDHTRVLPVEVTEDLSNPIQNLSIDAVNFSQHNLTNTSLNNSFSDSEMNLIQENIRIMEQKIDSLEEYIKMLEQVIDSLLPRN